MDINNMDSNYKVLLMSRAQDIQNNICTSVQFKNPKFEK